MEPTRTTNARVELRSLMDACFSLSDINTLCFDLHIDFENLQGSIKIDKIKALIGHCEQAGRLPELVEQCRRQRPFIAWPTFPLPLPPSDCASAPTPGVSSAAHRYHFLALGIALSILLVMLTLTGDSLKTAVSTPILISSFTVKHGYAPAILTPAEDTVQAAAGEILTVHVMLPAIAAQMTGLQFTWYTCEGGGQPVRTTIDNTVFVYTAPAQPGEDCIRLLLSSEDDLLAQTELFIVITK